MMFEVLFLALALSVDAFAVSFSCGLCIKKERKGSAIALALATGLGQFLMPVIGFFATP